MADASMCSEVPTQDTLPGFPDTQLGALGRCCSLLEFSLKQLGNNCQQLSQSLNPVMLLHMTYTGSECDPEVPKINTEGQTDPNGRRDTRTDQGHVNSLPDFPPFSYPSSITNMASPFPNYFYVKL